ncbi:hypothetical protein EDD28_0059 [Salana multivorans]|uniref:Nucleotidyltransferase-like protein n=1 Tax=Salana multivorans TaxID=120377 RepID=A0A3N2D6U6_9MICO|nr:hypothetical protein [Salana multivorans]ROR95506.1 hypothetical protein EDD28_0059 [Salana multivorans]
MEALLRTPHGSHLYGLADAESDLDTYTVIADGHRGSQSICDGLDATVIPLSRWLHLCDIGAHQALEAMFSRQADPSPLDPYRSGYRAAIGATADRYRRTIRNFILSDRYPIGSRADFKRNRHALRLVLNLNEVLTCGRFDPTLTPAQARSITEIAGTTTAGVASEAQRLSLIDLGLR